MPHGDEAEVTIEEAIDVGLETHEKGDLVAAESIYSQILEVDPQNSKVYHLLGVLQIQTGKVLDSLSSFDHAIDYEPGMAEAYCNKGLALQKLGRSAEAVENFQEAINHNPEIADFYVGLGSALDDEQRFDEAIKVFNKALTLDPQHADCYNNLGLVLHKLVEFDKAVLNFNKALAILPEFGEAHTNLGNSLMVLGRVEEALSAFQTATKYLPETARTQFNIGNALQKLGRLEEAVEAYEQANQRKSSYRVLHCLYSLNKKHAFTKKINHVLKEDPNDRAVAAVSAFASNQWQIEDPYPFCKNPIDLIQVSNVMDTKHGRQTIQALKDYFIEGHYRELPDQGHISNGKTSLGNLFDKPHPSLSRLYALIKKHVCAFQSEHSELDAGIIAHWPQNWRLEAWYLKISSGGQVDPHIHDPGWLSGTLYLNIPDRITGNEGAIAFGLNGDQMPILNSDYPRKICRVQTGDLVLFPSSLFHSVLPFDNKEERLCVAYDVIPNP